MPTKKHQEHLMMLESINWPQINQILAITRGSSFTSKELEREKQLLARRIKLMTTIKLSSLPCKYWMLNLQNHFESKRLTKQVVSLHFSPLQQQFVINLEKDLASPLLLTRDPEFDHLKDLLHQEVQKENYETCSLIKDYLDELLKSD
jgi:hypothetical protein